MGFNSAFKMLSTMVKCILCQILDISFRTETIVSSETTIGFVALVYKITQICSVMIYGFIFQEQLIMLR
jgi:hypothetical protein